MKGTEQRKTSDEIKRTLAGCSATHCMGDDCPYGDTMACVLMMHKDAFERIHELEADTTWHPFPAETPADGALVWVYAPSALRYWARYNYAEYHCGAFWRGAERVDNVTAWMTVKEKT